MWVSGYGDCCRKERVYGEVRLCRKDAGMSQWWKDVMNICEIREGEGGWFHNNLQRVLGKGSRVNFWHDTWDHQHPLSILFERLLSNSSQKRLMYSGYGSGFGGRRSGHC